ncbi:MAG: hypothetical protein IT329_08420 [Caldilineaceae bacterium]|nr:hypothetical protein [Caldilineaceae bacterium]
MATEPTATENDKLPQAGRPSTPGEPPVTDSPAANRSGRSDEGAAANMDTANADTANADTANADTAVVQCANLFLNVRRLLFLSLGALALTADEARDFVERLGERGDLAPGAPPELAQEELERWVDDLHHQHPVLTADGDRAHSAGRVDVLWGRLRVPTRREIEALSRKISALDQKLAALRAARTAVPPSASSTSGPAAPPESGPR